MSDNNNEVGMNFPETWEEYEQYYGFNDTEEVYSNNIRLIPSFRVKQWLDHLKTESCEDYAIGVDSTGRFVKASEVFREPCEDAISRQAVMDAIEELKKIHFDRVVVLNNVRDRVLVLPTVTQKQKMGRWIWVQYDGNPNIGNWHCSECNRIALGVAFTNMGTYKYCPNCGAKMESEGT